MLGTYRASQRRHDPLTSALLWVIEVDGINKDVIECSENRNGDCVSDQLRGVRAYQSP